MKFVRSTMTDGFITPGTATVDVTDNWQHIHINCSVMNNLTITYSNYVGSTTYRTTEEIRLECSGQVYQLDKTIIDFDITRLYCNFV